MIGRLHLYGKIICSCHTVVESLSLILSSIRVGKGGQALAC